MNILHVYKTYLPEDFTGIPRVIHALAEGMAGHGVETHVLALAQNPAEKRLAIGRHQVHLAHRDINISSAGFSLSAFGLFARLARTADVVNYHFPWPMADIMHLVRPHGRPSVVTYHSDVIKQKRLLPFYAPVRDRFLEQADAIIATSPSYIQTSAVLQRFADKTSVAAIGIPERALPAPELIAKWRHQLGDRFFLFVGTLRYYKGMQYLLDAARISGLPVVIAGADGAKNWQQGAGPNVQFLGEVTEADKEALLSLCAGFVLASHLRSEAFGIALLEAARAGRPMVSCEIGTGTSYINLHNQTGFVVAPQNGQALAEAMLRLSRDREQAEAMGHRARRRYEQEFCAPRMVENYLEIYRRVIAGRRANNPEQSIMVNA